jgi:pyruvate/2-oxoglutarate/acetoin dehydrogenase E1 component
MNYLKYFNNQISGIFSKNQNVYVYGQNIASGSYLSGLTRNLKLTNSSVLSNCPNSENSLVGIGFGAMLSGVNAVFCMKQQDFLLLGLDHIVNTNNILRNENVKGSFTIICIVEDGGYEGPQSASNNLSDFASFGRINCFSMTNNYDTKIILNKNLINPGFRIMGISQRLLSQNLIELECFEKNNEDNFFQYSNGEDVTILCFNFSLPYGINFYKKFKDRGVSTSLFSVNTFLKFSYHEIIQNVKRTKRVLIIDDSKSANVLFSDLLNEIKDLIELKKCHVIRREYSEDFYFPKSDDLIIDYKNIIDSFL